MTNTCTALIVLEKPKPLTWLHKSFSLNDWARYVKQFGDPVEQAAKEFPSDLFPRKSK